MDPLPLSPVISTYWMESAPFHLRPPRTVAFESPRPFATAVLGLESTLHLRCRSRVNRKSYGYKPGKGKEEVLGVTTFGAIHGLHREKDKTEKSGSSFKRAIR